MQHFNAHKLKTKDVNFHAGFTLIELLVATLIIGVMAAIASPSMLGFLRRSKVSSAHGALHGLLQNMQKESIKISQNCSLTFPTSGETSAQQTDSTLDFSGSCLSANGSINLEEVRVRHNLTTALVDTTVNPLFDFRGDTDNTLSEDVIFVVSQEDNGVFQKCIVVSKGLGLIRVGNYADEDIADIEADILADNPPTIDQCNTTS